MSSSLTNSVTECATRSWGVVEGGLCGGCQEQCILVLGSSLLSSLNSMSWAAFLRWPLCHPVSALEPADGGIKQWAKTNLFKLWVLGYFVSDRKVTKMMMYYSGFQKKIILLSFATTWMNCQGTVQREIGRHGRTKAAHIHSHEDSRAPKQKGEQGLQKLLNDRVTVMQDERAPEICLYSSVQQRSALPHAWIYWG